MAELGFAPIDDEQALELLLWAPACRIAAEILDGKRPPLAGARALDELFCEFDHPRELGDFCYAVAMSDPLVAVGTARLEQVIVDAARKLLRERA